MQTGLIILIVALVVVAVAGPAIGYAFARNRLETRERERSTSEQRIRELETELRRLRMPSATVQSSIAAEISRIRRELEQKDLELEKLRRSARPLSSILDAEQPSETTAAPDASLPPASMDAQVYAADVPEPSPGSGARRFDLEPPLFDNPAPVDPFSDVSTPDRSSAGPSKSTETPPLPDLEAAPQSASDVTISLSAALPTSAPSGDSAAVPVSKTAPASLDSPERKSPTKKSEAKPAEKPKFESVSDLIDAAEALEVSWLPDVTAGRRLKLRQLGYDDPVKLASLKASEIRRLARAVDVTEDEIRTLWMPRARKRMQKS